MSEIKPALTAEEWAVGHIEVPDRYAWIDGRSAEWLGYDRNEDLWWEERRHAVAALALHGQTFGFTWEDVDRLRNAANGLHSRPVFGLGGTPSGLLDLADRIAALLPPRT